MVDYYQVLGVRKYAEKHEIKRGYYKLALKWHPDKNPINSIEATSRFHEISAAYQVLSDDIKKLEYDCQLAEAEESHGNDRKNNDIKFARVFYLNGYKTHNNQTTNIFGNSFAEFLKTFIPPIVIEPEDDSTIYAV